MSGPKNSQSRDSRDYSFIVYIDESGDEGFTFRDDRTNKGSSSWFVISAVIFHANTELEEVKRIDSVREAIGRDKKKPLHFIDLSHEKRVAYAKMMSLARMQIVSVLVHKPSLSASFFSEKHKLYRYISRFVLERVSWACRERFGDKLRPPCAGDGSARVIFSNRRTMSYEDLRSYLTLLRENGEASIDWSIIDPGDVQTKPHSALRGLRILRPVLSSWLSNRINSEMPKTAMRENSEIASTTGLTRRSV